MNDRKTDETTPLAPHRPLTGPKTARPQSGVSQAPPRWNPNGTSGEPAEQPPRNQNQAGPKPGQPSGAGRKGRKPAPKRPPVKQTSASEKPPTRQQGQQQGQRSAQQTQPRSEPKRTGPRMKPAPSGPQPEMKPGPDVRGPEMRPTPAASDAGPPTEAMPRITAPTNLQPGPQQTNANARTQAMPRPAPAPQQQAKTQPQTKPRGRPRKARLRLARIDPWSVMKIAFALSIALAIVTVVAVSIVWAVLGAAGVWDSINESVAVVLSDNSAEFDIRDYVGMGRVVGLTMIVAAADVILITAIATLGAFLYNLAATMLGGLEITLAEDR